MTIRELRVRWIDWNLNSEVRVFEMSKRLKLIYEGKYSSMPDNLLNATVACFSDYDYYLAIIIKENEERRIL